MKLKFDKISNSQQLNPKSMNRVVFLLSIIILLGY